MIFPLNCSRKIGEAIIIFIQFPEMRGSYTNVVVF